MDNNYKIENSLNDIIDELNSVNDDFVNSYFENDDVIQFKENLSSEETEEVMLSDELSNNYDYKNDEKINTEQININEASELLDLIENTTNGEEFFEIIENGIIND